MSFTCFIDLGAGIAPVALDLMADATLADLYGAMDSAIGDINFRLSFAGIRLAQFDNDGNRPHEALADLGIGPEAQIQCETYEPQDWELLLRTLEPNLLDKYDVSWWRDAANCRQSPDSTECTNQAICTNPNWSSWIQCDDTDHFTTIDASTETNIFRLNGVLSLHSLPPTVKSMNLRDHFIENVLLGELSELNQLSELNLCNNQLTQIDLRGLGGTCLKELYLSGNQIFEVDFSPLKGTALLNHLTLDRNMITTINIRELVGSALTHLNVKNNPIQYIDFKGISRTELTHLDWMTSDETRLCGNFRFKCKQRIKNYGEIKKSKLDNKNVVDTIWARRYFYYFAPAYILMMMVLVLLCHQDLLDRDYAYILGFVVFVLQHRLNL